ncbi:glutathione S-transferase [Musa troglodytarum]|uniref:Glutathione S-transferase n=1 Tax=Musa troglodytarum TaxID=320322 RepID=A0A9E7JLP0_9LILI|nr:glutathione S-transferase [Musa troglodytarum]
MAAAAEGGEVKLIGGWPSPEVGREEPAAPGIQPCLQEDPGPHPQPQPRLRVHDHRRVRRGFPSMIAAVKAETQEARAEAMEQSLAGLELLEESLAKLSKGRGFVGGDAMAYLDIALGCYLGWMKACETVIGHRFLDEEKTPLLVGWAERFCSHEAVKDWMPETDELLELAKVLQPKRKVSTAN